MPSFFPENNTPAPFDSERRALLKIVGLLAAAAPAAGNAAVYHGNGNPNGSQVADQGDLYVQDDAAGTLWFKTTDGVNTGWV